MKALVITNCATAAYTSGLRALFPDWDVRGAGLALARTWLGAEPNADFRTFLAAAQLLLVPDPDEPSLAKHLTEKDVLVIPYFYFRAFHPDSFHLGLEDRAVPSVLGSGNLHSRIAAAAYLLGMSESDTVAAFNARVYERLGYCSLFESEKADLLERFAARGIDLAADYGQWMQHGNFLYTYNHPRAFVFNDILCRALCGRLLDARRLADARATLASIPDYLEPVIRWPAYPGTAPESQSGLVWRTGVAAGPETIALPDFVARSFDVFRKFPDLGAHCVPGFDRCRAALTD